ncbi:TIGR03086 family metal-binding protein [Amycolatopsis sp.]|uniref:TIGR03086 family metal-binding protein n=1 Tax=Amycolatopsis sp. TaxID=37632 RepID=UPI002BFEDB4A|nr:TIGR03086 family metal-binding protein [Amycolatopsis sp.]HVV10620.1 TIGR03086 family metal-binding protein [Amycolatopsis sp.]
MNLLDAHAETLREFDEAVHRIGAGQWDAPTPCSGWTVRDLLNHLVSEQLWVPHLLAGQSLAEVGTRYDGDVLGEDPVAAWESAAAAAREAWTGPGATEREVELSFGRSPATDYGWQMTLDLAVHAWDLCTAIGAGQPISEEIADQLLTELGQQIQDWQGLGIFDPPVPLPVDAPAAAELIALTGRKPG